MSRGVVSHPFLAAASAPHRRPPGAFAGIAWLLLSAALIVTASATQVSRDTALRAATGWLARNPAPMGIAAGHAGRVATGSSDTGEPLFYVLNLEPTGYVVLSADDEVEPVLAFSSESDFRLQPGTPLFDLLKHDARLRIAAARHGGQLAARSVSPRLTPAHTKWSQLLNPEVASGTRPRGLSNVSDVCVAPMVQSHWDQMVATPPGLSPDAEPFYIYNYFLPPYWPGNPYNYNAGCAPVAWAQIMRFHEWPKTIGTGTYVIGIDSWPYWESMMGGDGNGGPYDWSNMPLDPGPSTTPTQIYAIAMLMHDAGVGTSVDYTYYGTYGSTSVDEIKNVFHYAEARSCLPNPGLDELLKAARTSVEAGLPANLNIFTYDGTGHSLVIDGYGYTAGTAYYHLNLGWSGHEDGWYNFPPVDITLADGSTESFTIITSLTYNIEPRIAGHLLTGRVTGEDGQPIEGVTLAVNTTPVRTATSDSHGIYAFKGLAPSQTYTVSAAAAGYVLDAPQATVTMGDDAAESLSTPNRIVDFRATAIAVTLSNPAGTGVSAPLTLTVPASAAEPVGWSRNGVTLADTAARTLTIPSLQPADAGLYLLALSRAGQPFDSALAIVGVDTTAKVAGTAHEINSNVYVEANGNTFDQVLLEGAAASVTSDYLERQITRISYVDLDDDIVQVEYSGPGTLTLTLDQPTGPALPANYAQDVKYMKGHAGIVIAGATEDSHLSIFSVGRANAVNQALFKPDATYDGIADLAFVAIASRDGKFGGVRAANANFFAMRGVTGIYAPGVEITGPLYVGNVTAFDAASPMIFVGSAADVRITGGDLYQDNGRAIQVSGLAGVAFRDGTDSHGHVIPAKANRGTLRENGLDVTARLVVPPPPAVNSQ